MILFDIVQQIQLPKRYFLKRKECMQIGTDNAKKQIYATSNKTRYLIHIKRKLQHSR